MKVNVLGYITLFYINTVMANNICAPTDICLLIDNNVENHTITCDKITDYNLVTFLRPSDEIEIILDSKLNLSELIKEKKNKDFSLESYIFGRKLNKISFKNINLNKIMIPLYKDNEVFSSKELINCIDMLKKGY